MGALGERIASRTPRWQIGSLVLAGLVAALAIALTVACSAPTTSPQSATPSAPAERSAPIAAAATAAVATASAVVLPAAVTAAAAPSPAAGTAPASPTTAAATSVTAAVPAATPSTPPASATPPSTLTPAAVAPAPSGPVAVTLLDSAIKLDRSSAPAGSVNFAIKNAGTAIHQLVVLRTDIPQDRIPVDPTQLAKVSQPGFIAETKDMGPGTSLVWPLSLAAGKYVLMCNQPAHYLVGMHTAFTIQ